MLPRPKVLSKPSFVVIDYRCLLICILGTDASLCCCVLTVFTVSGLA